MITAAAYDRHLDQLFEIVKRLHAALTKAGIEYRIVGGMGVFFQVSARDPLAARSTKDVDVAVNRSDLEKIAAIAAQYGFRYRHAAGVDMLVDAGAPKERSPVHFVFAGEKVRPQYVEAVPDFSKPTVTGEGFFVAPVSDLVRMKLTSLRLIDKVHILDLDAAGLITPEIESGLSEILRRRLQQVREEERQSAGAE